MALTLTEKKVIEIGQSEADVYGEISFLAGDTYTTNGFDVSAQIPGSVEYEQASGSCKGYVVHYAGAGKFMLYRQTAATGALVEVPNATDVSAASPIVFRGLRPA
jgi:outer membrane usher protein FimD/PapC